MGFRLSNFYADPFAVSTISFGIIAWIVAIAGAGASDQGKFPHYSWWGIVFEIVIILAMLVMYLFDIIELYKFMLVGMFAIAFVYTTNTTNNLIYNTSDLGNLCCAAGNILLSFINVIWILYFGGHPESPTNRFVDSFSVRIVTTQGHLDGNAYQQSADDDEQKHISSFTNNYGDVHLRHSRASSNNQVPYMSSSQLNGLENFSSNESHRSRNLTNNEKRSVQDGTTPEQQNSMQFRYKAVALYSYEANPDDINEISFSRDEILDVDEIDGKWWQARKSNGQIGICPSNYVKLLD